MTRQGLQSRNRYLVSTQNGLEDLPAWNTPTLSQYAERTSQLLPRDPPRLVEPGSGLGPLTGACVPTALLSSERAVAGPERPLRGLAIWDGRPPCSVCVFVLVSYRAPGTRVLLSSHIWPAFCFGSKLTPTGAFVFAASSLPGYPWLFRVRHRRPRTGVRGSFANLACDTFTIWLQIPFVFSHFHPSHAHALNGKH